MLGDLLIEIQRGIFLERINEIRDKLTMLDHDEFIRASDIKAIVEEALNEVERGL